MVRYLGLISIGLRPTSDFQSICKVDLRSTPNISALADLFARSHWTVADGLLPLFATEGSHPQIGGTRHVRSAPTGVRNAVSLADPHARYASRCKSDEAHVHGPLRPDNPSHWHAAR